jgi:hypothetical protein
MGWILLLLAAACFAVPFLTTSAALGVLSLLLSLLLGLIGVLSLLSGRMADNSRGEMSPAELQALRDSMKRQQAEQAPPSAKNE